MAGTIRPGTSAGGAELRRNLIRGAASLPARRPWRPGGPLRDGENTNESLAARRCDAVCAAGACVGADGHDGPRSVGTNAPGDLDLSRRCTLLRGRDGFVHADSFSGADHRSDGEPKRHRAPNLHRRGAERSARHSAVHLPRQRDHRQVHHCDSEQSKHHRRWGRFWHGDPRRSLRGGEHGHGVHRRTPAERRRQRVRRQVHRSRRVDQRRRGHYRGRHRDVHPDSVVSPWNPAHSRGAGHRLRQLREAGSDRTTQHVHHGGIDEEPKAEYRDPQRQR